MDMLLIVNPIAGRGKATRSAAKLAQELSARGHQVDMRETQQAGDAAAFAKELSADCARLIVAGGDGTLNEVLNGLVLPTRCPLAHLAVGTANLMAKELHLPRRMQPFVELLERGSVIEADLGCVVGRRFVAVGSCGFDAEVTRQVQRMRSGSLGYLGYIGPTLRALTSFPEPELSITLDDGVSYSGALVVVSNIQNYGGLIRLADRAEPNSGHFDVCILPRARRRELVRTLLIAGMGRISRSSAVIYRTARKVRVESAEAQPVQLDGDYFGETPVTFEMLPERLPLLSANPAHIRRLS